jgi:hypothetical protein
VASKIREKRLAASKRYYQSHRDEEIRRNVEKQKRYRRRNRAYVDSVLLLLRCVDCGNSDHEVLDFDHVRGEKVGNISDLVGRPASIKQLREEIDKCEVRCANCHRKITKLRNREVAISPAS